MIYYGLAYSTSDFGGNPYLNFFLGFAIEIPTIMICQVSQRFCGRRPILSALYIIDGVALLGILAVPTCELHFGFSISLIPASAENLDYIFFVT